VPSLRADVEELLERCCSDTDDECRDRATFFLMLLRSSSEELVSRWGGGEVGGGGSLLSIFGL
jgi:hypothetical protein